MDAADGENMPRTITYRIAVIVDEYCSNLIRHDTTITSESFFTLKLEAVDGGARITIGDNAHPFDPTAGRIVEENRIGGQGLGLIRGLASKVDYVSGPNGNELHAFVSEDDKLSQQD